MRCKRVVNVQGRVEAYVETTPVLIVYNISVLMVLVTLRKEMRFNGPITKVPGSRTHLLKSLCRVYSRKQRVVERSMSMTTEEDNAALISHCEVSINCESLSRLQLRECCGIDIPQS